MQQTADAVDNAVYPEKFPVGGQISYRGNAGDQERVKGNEGQKAYINFTLGSGIVK